jgi:hypothetical protein
MATCRSPLKNKGNLNLQLILNNNSPWAHTNLELDVLGVAGKLLKYIIRLSKKKLEKKFKKSSHVLLKQQTTSFWLQGILGVKQSFYIVVENDNKLLNYQKPIKVKLLNCYKYLKSQLIQVEVLMV